MPNPNYDEFPVTFEKGLTTEIEESVLEEGQLAELTNWEPTPQGGLRARNAWAKLSTVGLPSTRKVRGWGTIATAPTGGGGGAGAITLVQYDTKAGALGADETTTLTGVTVGNLLVGFALDSTDAALTASGWTLAGSFTGVSPGSCFFWYKQATSSTESLVVTTGLALEATGIYELKDAKIQTFVDSAHSNDNTSNTLRSIDVDVTETGMFAVGTVGVTDGVTDEPFSDTEAGWTISEDNIAGANYQNWVAHKLNPSIGTESIDWDPTFTSNQRGVLTLWEPVDATASPTDEIDFYIVIAVATGTGYSVYRILRDQITTGTWELLDSATASDTSAYVAFSQGSGYLVWSASTITTPRKILLSGPTASDIAGLVNKSGRAVQYHKDRMFVAGESDLPSRLYFSAIADPASFTTATDFLDIGGDDGEAIQDLVSVEGYLLVCKTNRLYLISGSGIESFFVTELPGGTAAAGRAAVRTPYGTIVAGPTDIWVVQGGGVDPLARSLGADYSISGLVSTAYAQDVALIGDAGTGIVYRVNLVTGSWSKERVTTGENSTGHLFSLQGRFYYGVISSNTEVGGTRRLSSSRIYDALTNSTVYSASTGRVAMNGPSVKYTPQKLFIQSRLQGTSPNTLFIVLETNITSTNYAILVTDDTQRDLEVIGALHKGCEWMQFHFNAAASPQNSAIDIERLTIGAISERNR